MSREGRSRWGAFQTFVIGRQDNPMMKRLRLIQTPLFGLYLHFIYREDLDPVPHDHPWNFWRLVLRGGYGEEYLDDPKTGIRILQAIKPWTPTFFPTTSAHRIWHVEPGTVSLVLVGPKRRTWGFWTVDEKIVDRQSTHTTYTRSGRLAWVDYRDALGLRPSEGVSA